LGLLLARALAGDGRKVEARAEFEALVERFGSFEAKAEYAIWAVLAGDTATAAPLKVEIDHAMKHWNRHTRDLNAPLIRRLNAAFETADKSKR